MESYLKIKKIKITRKVAKNNKKQKKKNKKYTTNVNICRCYLLETIKGGTSA